MKLAILDAGAQYGKVIDRKVRELGVESEILPLDTPLAQLKKYQALIISGGPESVYGAKAPKYDPKLFHLQKPILGICYGMQMMAHTSHGVVEKKSLREDGQFTIIVDPKSPLFSGLKASQEVLLTHGDTVENPGEGFRIIAKSQKLIAGIENLERQLYGVQFHPEVDLTINGKKILANFLFKIAGFTGDFTLEDREAQAIAQIRRQVGKKKVLVLVSGGVDSTVCAALMTKALGANRVFALHIDSGFMRLNESRKVATALKKIGLKLKVVNAAQEFYRATTLIDHVSTKPLNQTLLPEEKRKIIGDTFMKVAAAEIAKLNLNPDQVFLVQGTLRPDLIESAAARISSNAHTIKTHHNDSHLARQLRAEGKVIEPLSDYHKDEVRKLGEILGLPAEIVWRQPFPGPGLSIRIICADQPFVTDDFDQIEHQLKINFAKRSLATTLIPIKTVGVQGDARTYSYVAGLSGKPNWPELFLQAKEIPKKIHQVNRVIYIFGQPIKRQIKKITPTKLTKEVIGQLQQADEIVNQILLKYDLLRSLSQVPVILFPIDFDGADKCSIAIRTFITNDFMTGVPARPGVEMPELALNQMVKRILTEVPGISRVAYDLTAKPPGTTEWE